MNTHQLKTVDGATFDITEDQMKQIIQSHENGEKRIYLKGAWLNLNTVNIYPIDSLPQNEGYLHDGTKVIKKFGEWKDAQNPNIRLDPHHYPEIARDDIKRTREDAIEANKIASTGDKPLLETSK